MSIINKIRNTMCNKSIRNGIWMYLLQAFNTIMPLLTLPYVTRILNASEYGVFSVALNFIGYLQVVIEYGFGMSATRKVALSNRRQDVNALFSAVLYARFFLLICCTIFLTAFITFTKMNPKQATCILILMISLLGYCVQQNWLFQGMQKMKYIAIANIMARSISVALIFMYVKSEKDIYLYCLLYAVSPFLSGIVSLILARKEFHIMLVKTKLEDIWSELKQGWYVFTTSLSSKIFGAIGITFLGFFASYEIVGRFSALQKIPSVMLLAWTPISQVMYPEVSKKMCKSFYIGEKFVLSLRRKILPVFIIMSVIVALNAKLIVTIAFGDSYADYYYWLFPLILWLLVSINNNFLGIQILLGSGHDKEYSHCFQIGIISTIFFNAGLIYLWQGTGAAIAPLISETILGIALKIQVIKIKKQNNRSISADD